MQTKSKFKTIVLPFLIIAFYFSVEIYSQEKLYPESNIRELHRKYMEASINHDIETLRALTHDEVIWYLGSDTLKGKEAALAPHEYDAGYKTTLKYSNVVVNGDTVRFNLLETNEQVRFFGMEGIRFYPQFIFKDGLVYRKMPWNQSPDLPELMRLSRPLINWVKTNHQGALRTIRKPNGDFKYSYKTGKLLLQLFNQWRDKHGEIFKAIQQRHKIASRAMKNGDVKAYVELFTEGGIYMWPGVPAIAGHKALQIWFEKRFAQYSPEIDTTLGQIC